MEYIDLEVKKLKGILNEIRAGVDYKIIADMYGYSYEDFKSIVESFCKNYNCKIVVNEKDRTRAFIREGQPPIQIKKETEPKPEPKQEIKISPKKEVKQEEKKEIKKETKRKPKLQQKPIKEPKKESKKEPKKEIKIESKPKQSIKPVQEQQVNRPRAINQTQVIEPERKPIQLTFEDMKQIQESEKNNEHYLQKMIDLKQWCYRKGRLPRNISAGAAANNPELLREKEYFVLLNFIKEDIVDTYSKIYNIDITKDELYVKMLEIIIEIENEFNKNTKYKTYKKALDLKNWVDKIGFKPEGIEKSDTLDEALQEERLMYDYLLKIRKDNADNTIPWDQKYYLRYVLRRVNTIYSKSDMEFLETLRIQINREDITLTPQQIELLKDIVKGKALSRISVLNGISIEDVYRILNKFCDDYNCELKFGSNHKNTRRWFAPRGKEISYSEER